MRVSYTLAAAAACFALAGPASATIVLDVGAGDLQPDENLLFTNDPDPGLTIQGITNQSDTLVSITGGETLVADGSRVDSDDGFISTGFTFGGQANQLVGFDMPGFGFTSTEFRLFGGTATQATLTFVDTDGQVFTQTFDIPANGFFNALATDGQLIDSFSISADGTLGDIRQIRFGGLQVVPEPATWAMMIVGFGGVGAIVRRRKAFAAAV